jgi:phosphoglycolate phosphatase
MPIRAALFDFDGTLADSFAAITASTNHVRRSFGLPDLPESTVRAYVGFGLPNLMQELLPGHDVNECVARYREHHTTVIDAMTKLMPGVAETIPELARRGYRMAVCSNKMVRFTTALVSHLGLSPYFSAVLGPDDVSGQPKPDPAMVLEALRRLEVPASDAVYVGDMAIDVHTAKAAGLPVWIVPGGATGLESAAGAGPDRVLHHFQDMLDLLPAVSGAA